MKHVERELARAARPSRAPWIAGAALAAVGAAAGAVAITRSSGADACAAPELDWGARAAVFAGYQARWLEAHACMCGDPRGAEQVACLDRARARVEAALAIGDGSQHARALEHLPGPERCIASPSGNVLAFDPRRAQIEAFASAGRLAEARALLPAPEADGPELALVRARLTHEARDHAGAEHAYRRAAELAGREGAIATLADAQLELAVLVGFSLDRHDAGAAYADAARATSERLGDRRRIALAALASGMIQFARGDAGASQAMTAALADLAAHHPDPLELALAEKRVGWVLHERHREKEARAHLERARALRVSVLGEDAAGVAQLDTEIGMTESGSGEYARAIARFRDIIAKLTRLHGPASFQLSEPLSALGAAQLRSGDHAGAEASFRRVLELRRAALGDRHEDVARAQLNLASTLYTRGRFADAVEAYRAAEATARSVLGAKHPTVAVVRSGLALALQASRRLDEAQTVVEGTLAILRERPGHDAELADTLAALGMIELERERLPAARAALEESYAIQRHVRGDDHVALAPVLSTLGELYLEMGLHDEARRSVERSRELRVRHGAARQAIAENDFILALIADARGARPEARRLAAQALEGLGDARPDLRRTIERWRAEH